MVKRQLDVAPFETDASTSFLMHLLKTTPKSTANWVVVNLIRNFVTLSRNPTNLVGPVVDQCAAHDGALKVVEVYKLSAIIVEVTKTIRLIKFLVKVSSEPTLTFTIW